MFQIHFSLTYCMCLMRIPEGIEKLQLLLSSSGRRGGTFNSALPKHPFDPTHRPHPPPPPPPLEMLGVNVSGLQRLHVIFSRGTCLYADLIQTLLPTCLANWLRGSTRQYAHVEVDAGRL